jgi:hypothetical protein
MELGRLVISLDQTDLALRLLRVRQKRRVSMANLADKLRQILHRLGRSWVGEKKKRQLLTGFRI